MFLTVYYHKKLKKVIKQSKTEKPVFWKITGFLPEMKTDGIFGIYGIENPEKHFSDTSKTCVQ